MNDLEEEGGRVQNIMRGVREIERCGAEHARKFCVIEQKKEMMLELW